MMTSLQCSRLCQVSTAAAPTAMNGTTVAVPVRTRSSRSFATGSMSSRSITVLMLRPQPHLADVLGHPNSWTVEGTLQGKYPPDDRK